MSDQLELVVPFDKKNVWGTLFLAPFLMYMAYLLFQISSELKSVMGYWISFFMKSFFASSMALFGGMFIFSIFWLAIKGPIAVLNQKGIWVRNFGFINWREISEFGIYKTPSAPIETIAIRVNNLSLLQQQATFSGKCAIFWSKIFGYPPVFLASTAARNYEILVFAKRFIEVKW